MAAGPADAFSATPRGFGCYDRELITAAADNLWSSSVVATASTGASWVEDVHSDPVEKRTEELRRKFHHGRQLQIKHLPREVTEESFVCSVSARKRESDRKIQCAFKLHANTSAIPEEREEDAHCYKGTSYFFKHRRYSKFKEESYDYDSDQDLPLSILFVACTKEDSMIKYL
ncbi:unnamed protein product [Allacma fusca]|uniref:Uncharacterized protein n=1 Tax=Allacma fusca TaxID=39272 RepID=A0A8J2KSH4_9HEXA|nr:unnamed protein product [Allacma fusca]